MNMFERAQSLPALVMNILKHGNFDGFFHRENDAWVLNDSVYMQDCIYRLALALRKLGVESGIGVGIIAPSSPKWFMIDIATQIAGGYIVPLFPNISSEHFNFQVKDSDIKVLFIDGLETISKQIDLFQKPIESVIYLAQELSEEFESTNTHSWNSFLELGKSLSNEEERKKYDERIANISQDEIFSIIYTSGSQGTPKGVPLMQKNMILHLRATWQKFPIEPHSGHLCLSILPMAHIFERMVIYFFSGCLMPVYFADSPNNLGKYLPELRPTVLSVVPRILEKLYEKLITGANQKKGPAKWIAKMAIRKAKNADPDLGDLRGTIWDKLVYSKMRAALGDNFYLIMSGSSALNISVNRFLRNIGIPLLEGYGMTECSPVIAAESVKVRRVGSVGKRLNSVEIRVSSEGEILVKGGSVFGGYFKKPELNAEVFTEDGFFKTGDKGYIDEDDFVWITGRIKEMFKTSTGKYVSPVPIEQALCQRAVIEAAQVFADGRKFTSAILFLNQDIIRAKFKKSELDFKPERALNSRRLNAILQKYVDGVNKHLNEWEKIKKWKAVFATLSTENGLLTPTLKLRRKVVERIFANEINDMYE